MLVEPDSSDDMLSLSASWLIVAVVLGALLMGPWVLSASTLSDERLSRMEAKLDLILSHLGLTYDPLANVPPDVLEAVRNGEKIEAIKRYRAATGADLAEAKDRVEELEAELGV